MAVKKIHHIYGVVLKFSSCRKSHHFQQYFQSWAGTRVLLHWWIAETPLHLDLCLQLIHFACAPREGVPRPAETYSLSSVGPGASCWLDMPGTPVICTDIQQQTITWLEIRLAVPPIPPPGLITIVHMSLKVSQQDDGVIRWSIFKQPTQWLQEGWPPSTVIWCVRSDGSLDLFPGVWMDFKWFLSRVLFVLLKLFPHLVKKKLQQLPLSS